MALAAGLVRNLGIAQDLNRDLSLLASHRPFHESDHVLTYVYNLYAGGTCIEDIVDLDSCVRPVYGDQKEGTDFTYKGSFGYHPLVISLAGTLECLRLVNCSGNEASAAGSEDHLRDSFPMLSRSFKQVIVRGDAAFAKQTFSDD